MQVEPSAIPGLRIIRLTPHGDLRGSLTEVFNHRDLKANGILEDWVLDIVTRQAARHTMRGMHFQTHPRPQAKLVRVSRGSIFDVVVDIRQGSPTYGQHVGIELSDSNWTMLYIPIGLAHGYVSLEPDTEVSYKFTDAYDSACSTIGLRWDDPDLGIAWPVGSSEVIMAQRDRDFPCLRDMPPLFGPDGGPVA